MIFMDPPEHDVHRKLVGRAFTPRAVSDVEPYARSVAASCLDALRERGGGDFVEEFSAILPMNVIMELLGVPAADRNQVRHWMDATLERLEEPPYFPASAIDAMKSVSEYWFALVADKRRSADDGRLISRLCRVEVDGVGLTDAEVAGFCSLIGSAGTETLTKLLANAVVLFQRNPAEWQKVLDDPGVVPGAVEEVLRYWAPSQYQGRTVTDDVTYHDVTMPAGSRVLLLTASANRDEREYPDPDRFDVTRPSHVPIGLGHGLHFCLGAALARLEGRVGIEEFAARVPRFELDEAEARRVHMSNVHGFASVPFAAGH
jgi:cytochrome P450